MNYRKLVLIALTLVTVLSCGSEDQRLNVVIIAVDTLRPDFLGCYGAEANTSPNIDRLAATGVLLENAISQAPWTLPSFATVFTSLYPTQHGASTVDTRMRTGFPTLASILRENGYATGAIINAPVLKPEFGLNRGFDHYDVAPDKVERRADRVTEDALEWIGLHKGGPFFAFVHYFDPHLSYSPPAPYDTLFDPGYNGPIGRSFDLDHFASFRRSRRQSRIRALPDADRNHIECLYRGEIAFTDQAIGTLLEGLVKQNLVERTLIVFLSDHGEEFLEHGGLDHGHSLFDELIRVPLVFSLPGKIPQNRRISRYVRLLDVTPTIIDLLGLTSDVHHEGISLTALLRSTTDANEAGISTSAICYSEALRRNSAKKSVTAYPWKLIYDLETEEKTLFNLEDDPGETDNLSGQDPPPLSLLEETLLKTLFRLSDTWYVEMAAGGEVRTFDLSVAVERGTMIRRIHLATLFDEKGRLLDLDQTVLAGSTPYGFRIEGLRTAGSLTLAFKSAALPYRSTDHVARESAANTAFAYSDAHLPLEFNLRIDGKPAIKETFVGASVGSPREMPFSTQGAPDRPRAEAKPAAPSPPYFLIWYSESRYKGPTRAALTEGTRRQLRALGYIQ
jgi:arylsulfatase A-like enzyme